MKHISLGGLDVSRIGLGTMAMSGCYLDANSSDAESIRTIHRALDLGVTHLDTAEIYGPFINEELVGRAIKDRREQVVLARVEENTSAERLELSPAHIERLNNLTPAVGERHDEGNTAVIDR